MCLCILFSLNHGQKNGTDCWGPQALLPNLQDSIEGPHHSLKTAVAEFLLLGPCNRIIQFQPEEERRKLLVPSDDRLLQAIPSLT